MDYLQHSIAYITSGKKEIKRYIECWRGLNFAFYRKLKHSLCLTQKKVTQKKVTLCYTEKCFLA